MIEHQFGIEGKLVDVSRIKQPPINYLYIDGDMTCPVEKQKEYAKKIPSTKSEETIYGRSHSYVVGDNDDEFFERIMANL